MFDRRICIAPLAEIIHDRDLAQKTIPLKTTNLIMEALLPSRDESEPRDAIQERHGARRTAEDTENDEGVTGDGQVQSTETSSSTGVSGDVGCFRTVYNFLYGRQLPPVMMLRSLCLSSALFFIQASFLMLEEKRVSVVESMHRDDDDVLSADETIPFVVFSWCCSALLCWISECLGTSYFMGLDQSTQLPLA